MFDTDFENKLDTLIKVFTIKENDNSLNESYNKCDTEDKRCRFRDCVMCSNVHLRSMVDKLETKLNEYTDEVLRNENTDNEHIKTKIKSVIASLKNEIENNEKWVNENRAQSK